MPRRNNAPVQRSSRRRNNTYRRGTILTLLNERGQWSRHEVLHSNCFWTTVREVSTGAITWIETRGQH